MPGNTVISSASTSSSPRQRSTLAAYLDPAPAPPRQEDVRLLAPQVRCDLGRPGPASTPKASPSEWAMSVDRTRGPQPAIGAGDGRGSRDARLSDAALAGVQQDPGHALDCRGSGLAALGSPLRGCPPCGRAERAPTLQMPRLEDEPMGVPRNPYSSRIRFCAAAVAEADQPGSLTKITNVAARPRPRRTEPCPAVADVTADGRGPHRSRPGSGRPWHAPVALSGHAARLAADALHPLSGLAEANTMSACAVRRLAAQDLEPRVGGGPSFSTTSHLLMTSTMPLPASSTCPTTCASCAVALGRIGHHHRHVGAVDGLHRTAPSTARSPLTDPWRRPAVSTRTRAVVDHHRGIHGSRVVPGASDTIIRSPPSIMIHERRLSGVRPSHDCHALAASSRSRRARSARPATGTHRSSPASGCWRGRRQGVHDHVGRRRCCDRAGR